MSGFEFVGWARLCAHAVRTYNNVGTKTCPPYLLHRHSRAGGNPARINILRSSRNSNVAPLRGRFFNQLDSRLRGNDETP
jgi:hypothetical protein